MELEQILLELKSLENPANRAGMARFGINVENALGISMKSLEPISKRIKKNHKLGLELWGTGIHDARILAILISEANKLTLKQVENWVNDFDSWDICDQACLKLFRKSAIAIERINDWIKNEKEFVRRAGFALLATLAVHLKGQENDYFFVKYFDQMLQYSVDERNFVKKAVNWAIRQTGKRNEEMRKLVTELCENILTTYSKSKSAKWIAQNALNELNKRKTDY